MTPEQQACWDAALLIERYGWIQHQAGSMRRGFCMSGAIDASRASFDATSAARKLLFELLRCQSAITWNDTPYRTAEEVIDALVIASQWEES